MRHLMALTMALATVSGSYAAETPAEESVGLTIYTPTKLVQARYINGRWTTTPPGYATVRERRRMDLEQGVNSLRFTDVAKRIKPETVHFVSLTDPEGTFVLEQNYEYDLISASKLLEKYIDREITVVREDKDGKIETEAVQLLSNVQGSYVIKREDAENPIEIVDRLPRVRLGAVPGGLITRPTLVWLVNAKKAQQHLCKVTYETEGIQWRSSYTAVMKKDDTAADFCGWVTIENESGATYRNAAIKLVAGDVRGHAASKHGSTGGTGGGRGTMKTRQGGFSGKSFFEFHLYTLGRRSTVKDNSRKQLELFRPVMNVPAKKMLVYFGAKGYPWFWGSPGRDRDLRVKCNRKVDIYLNFRNSAKVGLGIPLPKGTVRVYKEDPDDGSLEFIGEDEIDHTPRDEDVMLRLGSAFDIVGERIQTEFRVDYAAHWMEESFEIKVRNHKEEDVEIVVREPMYRWVNWDIIEKSQGYEKVTSRVIHFPVKIPADGERKVTYKVRYTW